MKAAVWKGKWEFEIEDRPIPRLEEDEVLVAVSYAGICASDVHIIEWGLFHPPLVLGHECSGTVEAFGSEVKGFQKADKVVIQPQLYCGKCYYCRRGQEHFCNDEYSTTASHRGAFAEYIIVKAKQVYRLPADTSLKDAALIEPLAIALHALDQSRMKAGEVILVIGTGPIGLLITQLARLSGAGTILITARSSFKGEFALKMGADRVVDPANDNLERVVNEVTEGRGVDVCFEAVGSSEAIEKGFLVLGKGGRLIIAGLPPLNSSIKINPLQLFTREIEIGSSLLAPYCFQRAVQLAHRLNLEQLITHCFNLSEIDRAMKIMRSGERIKVLLKP